MKFYLPDWRGDKGLSLYNLGALLRAISDSVCLWIRCLCAVVCCAALLFVFCLTVLFSFFAAAIVVGCLYVIYWLFSFFIAVLGNVPVFKNIVRRALEFVKVIDTLLEADTQP